jgi:ribose/xylose/arabinose/galactoside ABC-type transport system permease subunit
MTEITKRPLRETAKRIAKRIIGHENGILMIVLIALIAGMAVITRGVTASRGNVINILLQSSLRGVVSVGQAFVILSAGIDLSVGGIGLFSSLLGATMMTTAPELNIIGYPLQLNVAIPIMLLAGTSIGALNGLAVSRIGMPALIVTLAVWEILKGSSFLLCHGHAIGNQPEALGFLGVWSLAGIPVIIIIFILVITVAYFVLAHTSFGRSVYAVGGSPLSSWLSGINVKRVVFFVYTISGFCAALTGVITTARLVAASMQTLSGFELDSIAAVVIGGVSLMGGRGNILGVLIGVLIIGVVNNGFSVLGANPAVQGLVKGTIIFTAVAIDYTRRRGG